MTEQEKREKAIEEMAQILCESDISCSDCVKCTIYEGKHLCTHLRNASDIYYYILRREEEARNKTLKEAAKWLDEEKGFCGLGFLLLKHFGVEVEE